MPYFTKKPVRIEARQWDGTWDGAVRLTQWVTGVGGDAHCYSCPTGEVVLFIRTLEGEMEASPDDWVIRGVADEFYPCKPAIFDETYDSVLGS